MRRQAAGDAETDNSRTPVHVVAGVRYRCRKLGGQIAAITTAYDMHARSCGNACLKCQSDNDDHVVPTYASTRLWMSLLRSPMSDLRRRETTATGKAIRFSGLALGHDGRRSLALAGICTAGNAEECDNDCRSKRNLLHGTPPFCEYENTG